MSHLRTSSNFQLCTYTNQRSCLISTETRVFPISNGMKHGFKDRVLRVVEKIPKGQVLSYKQAAELAGSPRAYRAVGNIMNKNHDPKVPCHRVIRSDGKAGGYALGSRKKTSLLKKEGVNIKG